MWLISSVSKVEIKKEKKKPFRRKNYKKQKTAMKQVTKIKNMNINFDFVFFMKKYAKSIFVSFANQFILHYQSLEFEL